MRIELLMQNASYLFMAVGGAAFLTTLITQVIKEMPGLRSIQTNVVALTIAFVLCITFTVAGCEYFEVAMKWYYIFASVLAAFIVYLISTGGWEKVKKMWDRTKYSKLYGG